MSTQYDIWTYRIETTDPGMGTDVVGYSVEALDGGIGKVDEASDEVGASSIVVDTGPWIFGKKVVLPAGVIDRVDSEEETVYVNRTKDQIKDAPQLDEGMMADDRHRDEVERLLRPRRRGLARRPARLTATGKRTRARAGGSRPSPRSDVRDSTFHVHAEEGRMPLIEVKLYDRRVTEESVPKMIEALTNALAETSGADPAHIQVVIQGVEPKHWGIAGKQQA